MKKLGLVLLAGAVAASLAACGGSKDSASTTTAPAASAGTEAETAEAESSEAAASTGESMVLRCATNHSESFCTSKALQEFAKNVNERTDGRITIEIYYDAVLGEEKACLEQLQYGGLDLLRGNISPLAEFYDGLNALQMPFIYKDTQHFWDAHSTIGMEMMQSEEMQAAGLYGLTFYDGGARNFYNSKHEIHTPDDMKGLNVRVQESELMMGMVVQGQILRDLIMGNLQILRNAVLRRVDHARLQSGIDVCVRHRLRVASQRFDHTHHQLRFLYTDV